jgi:hypothetical protein
MIIGLLYYTPVNIKYQLNKEDITEVRKNEEKNDDILTPKMIR